MEIDPKILEAMANPEKLIDPRSIVNLRIKLAEIVDILKGDIFEQKLKVSQKKTELRATVGSAEMASNELMKTKEWRDLDQLVRLKERLNGFRADLKDKLILIVGQKF